jgi:hypothetical protein
LQKKIKQAEQSLYKNLGLSVSSIFPEPESHEYNACTFLLNEIKVRYRTAKITPTKVGQFVTFWKRLATGPIAPYHQTDDFDLLIIGVRKNDHIGQFIFTKSVLADKGILSTDIKEGKRGFRVYPPWDKADNSQAVKTQEWQLDYFLDLSQEKPDISKAQQLHARNNDIK